MSQGASIQAAGSQNPPISTGLGITISSVPQNPRPSRPSLSLKATSAVMASQFQMLAAKVVTENVLRT